MRRQHRFCGPSCAPCRGCEQGCRERAAAAASAAVTRRHDSAVAIGDEMVMSTVTRVGGASELVPVSRWLCRPRERSLWWCAARAHESAVPVVGCSVHPSVRWTRVVDDDRQLRHASRVCPRRGRLVLVQPRRTSRRTTSRADRTKRKSTRHEQRHSSLLSLSETSRNEQVACV